MLVFLSVQSYTQKEKNIVALLDIYKTLCIHSVATLSDIFLATLWALSSHTNQSDVAYA
jgi:hypothetical protein